MGEKKKIEVIGTRKGYCLDVLIYCTKIKKDMPAGGPYDHPISDILRFNIVVYGEKCDNLIKEISKFVSMAVLSEMFDWFDDHTSTEAKLQKLENDLRQKLEILKKGA